MRHPLERMIGAIRRRARRLVLLHALACCVAILLSTATLLALADYLIRFEDFGVRVICWLALVGLGGWALYRYLWSALAARFRDLDVALRVERRFPELQDRLASTVQFLRQREDDAEAGSAALRRAVITQTTADVEQLDLRGVIQTRPAYRAVLAALAVMAVAAVLLGLDTASARIGLVRLFNPLSETAWPKANHLVFANPVRRVASGQAFEVEVVDARGARLPDEVLMHYRFHGTGTSGSESAEPMRRVGKTMLARQENVSRPFAYRATGGDDRSMPWIELEVVEPPTVEQLTVALHYPEYTGWPPAAGDKHIRALVGTRVEMSARTTKPLSSAALHVENGPVVPARLSKDGHAFAIPAEADGGFVVAKSGAYWFELTDREGFPGGREMRYEVRAIEDLPPSVNVEDPAGNIFVTADAIVPLRVAAKDDLSLRAISLRFSRSDQSQEDEVVLPLYDGPALVERRPGALPPAEATWGETRTVDHRWDLGPLGLKPGVQLTLYATAADYRPAVGQSQPRRLTIITSDELADRLAERQNFILGELARLLKLQRDARTHVSGLEIQLDEVGRLTKQDIDRLQGVELAQRQVDRGLISDGEGVTTQIQGLLADLKNNKVDNPDIERRMQGLLDEIERLGSEKLPRISQELTAALKSAQAQGPAAASETQQGETQQQESPAADRGAVAEPLASAGKHQDDVVEALEQMLGELAQWDNYRRFHREIGQVRREQEEVARETAEIGRKSVTKDVKDLDPQQQADLKRLGARQLELARRLDKIQQRMEQMTAELGESDPLAAGAIADALHHARQEAIAGQMREAGRQVRENQVGQAAASQQQTSDALEEMLDILANRREHELERMVEKLRAAERQLAELREQQDGLRKKWQAAAENSDEQARRRELQRLSREQKELQAQAERFARQLKRLQADQAGRSAARGGAKMGQAGQQGDEDNAAGAAEQAAAAEHDLDQAQQQLAEKRQQAEMDLALEQLARLEDGLKSMRDRQERLLEETAHYDQMREAQGQLTRPQAVSVGDMGRQQHDLEQESRQLAQKLAAVKAFSLGLQTAARDMGQAAGLLDQRDTGAGAQKSQRDALARLDQMLVALKPDQPEPGGPEGRPQEGGQAGGPQQPGDGIRFISELKLLKLMQEQINARTHALEQAKPAEGLLTDDQQQEYAALSDEQGQVADLLLDLSQPSEPNPEDDPENLPELELFEQPADPGQDDALDEGLPKPAESGGADQPDQSDNPSQPAEAPK